VLEQPRLLLLTQLPVGIDARSVLDLVLGHLRANVLAVRRGSGQRHEMRLHAEQARIDRGPLGLTGLRILVDVADLADLLAVTTDDRTAPPLVRVRHLGHGSYLILGI